MNDTYNHCMILDDKPRHFIIQDGDKALAFNLQDGSLEITNWSMSQAAQFFWRMVSNEYKAFLQAKEQHERMRAALQLLIAAKEHKDKNGKDAQYAVLMPEAWDAARAALQGAERCNSS
jgi:hypothetical protein